MAEEPKKSNRRRKTASSFIKKSSALPEIEYQPVAGKIDDDIMSVEPVRTQESPTESFKKFKNNMESDVKDFGAEYLNRKQPTVQKASFMRGLIIIVVIGLVALSIGYMVSSGSLPSLAKGKQFSAIFLDNGQVYIGRIDRETRSDLILKDVFTIQVIPQQVQGADGTTQTIQQPQVIKKGSEFYGPESTIRINRELIAVIETLRDDSSIMPQIQAQLEVK